MDVFDIIGYAFLAGFFVLMAYAGWRAAVNFKARSYIRAALSGACCLGMFGCGAYVGVIPGFAFIHQRAFCEELFGKAMTLPHPRLSYESPRAFNGDGYSIAVFEMPDEFWSWLSTQHETLIRDYPKKPSFRSKWGQVRWHKTPLQQSEAPFLDFATAEYGESTGQLKEARELLLSLAHTEGGLVAYCHQSFGDRIGNIDFCLLNMQRKVFIALNHNT